MRIGIDARSLGIGGGVRTYLKNLLLGLNKLDEGNEYFIFYADKKDVLNLKGFNNIVLPSFLKSLPFWDQLLVYHIRKYKIDVFHGTKNSIPFLSQCKKVVTIHDVTPILQPETYRISERFYWKLVMPISAKISHKILTVSNNSKKDIINTLKIDPNKISVTYLAVSNIFKKKNLKEIAKFRKLNNLPAKFILYVGTIRPRKNVDTLIKALYLLKKERYPHKLVIVGKDLWKAEDIRGLVKELNLENDVIFKGFIEDEQLPYYYSAADLFAYVPSYEGFGIPLLEAISCECPTITSDVSSLPEVIGSAGLLVKPGDIDGLYNAILDILTKEDLRRKLIKSGKDHIKKFNWEECALNTLKVYNELQKDIKN